MNHVIELVLLHFIELIFSIFSSDTEISKKCYNKSAIKSYKIDEDYSNKYLIK